MQHLPINLLSLHSHEEDLRSKSLAAIQADRDLSRHLQAAHDAMEYLDVVRQQPATVNTDEHALTCLGLRLFNLGATTLKLSMSGYYQAAFALLRDAFEIVNLLDLFRIDQSAILVWRTADDKVQRLEFMPVSTPL